tara:strand:- start:16126 stop:16761 length:636 start_codon:yes stop_codon:yes gene_type:complete
MDSKSYIEQCKAHELRIHTSRSKLQYRRDQIVVEIEVAFKNVTRKGGISLAEVESLDAGASEAICKRIRESQRDKHWAEVDLRKHDPYGSGICFLDPIGFRYHLPAYMIDLLTKGYHIIDQSQPDEWMGHEIIIYRLCDTTRDGRESYSLLNATQRTCVARLLAFEVELLTTLYFDNVPDDSFVALKNYWLEHLPQADKLHLESIWPGCFN